MYPITQAFSHIVLAKHLPFYMDLAERTAQLSSAKRRQVGAVIVTPNRSIWIGYNGMPSGMSNDCELPDGTTNPFVIHAEANALDKLASEGISAKNSVCFTTCFPCPECAKRLCAAGVKWVIYREDYHTDSASQLFAHYGVSVLRYSDLMGSPKPEGPINQNIKECLC